MEACIEALFNIEGENGRRKTIEMIRVLKGAISVSKSKTGEVIYQYNRQSKKALRKQLAKYDNDTKRSRCDIEHQKRDILRKWSLVFGRQRNFCESIRGFDDMLAEAILLRDRLKDEHGDSDDEDGESQHTTLTEVERRRVEEEEKKKKELRVIEDPRKRRIQAMLNPSNTTNSETELLPNATGILPKINMTAGGLFHSRRESEEEEKARLEREAEEERKRKAKALPSFDKELMKDYLREQRHMHEDLLTRNALMKIKSQAEKDHIFFKYRMKTKLPGSAHSLLQQLENERPQDPDSRAPTRQSARSEGALTRGDTASNRPDTRQTGRPDTRQMGRPDTRQTGRPETRQTQAWTDTKKPTRPPPSRDRMRSLSRLPSRMGPRRIQRASTTEVDPDEFRHITNMPLTGRSSVDGSVSVPKMERSKTVHFS